MKINYIIKIAIAIIAITIIGLSTSAFIDFQSKRNKRSQFCRSGKPLTAIEVKDYEANGVKRREGTIFRKIFINSERKILVFIFPLALSSQGWQKLPQSSIQYISAGGDGDRWQEWLRPDYYYLVEVPPQATGLAFARLCYRNGDVTVYPVNKVKLISQTKIAINDKIYLTNPGAMPKVNQSHIVVNAGSDRRDTLGSQTEVYFTTRTLIDD